MVTISHSVREMRDMCGPFQRARRLVRRCTWILSLPAAIGLVGCDTILDVELPGRIPAEQIDDPALASILAQSVIGDLECAYNNYVMGAAVHSDEFEGAIANLSAIQWSHRNVTEATLEYVSGTCETTDGFFPGGMHVPMQTARFLSENVFERLEGWTDAQVANRSALMATVRAYGGYTYTFFGETYCSIAFDGGPVQQPAAALGVAEQRFAEAMSLAQGAGATDILNMAGVGMARVKMNLKKWAQAAAAAAPVPAGFRKDATRSAANPRRYNRLFLGGIQNGYYVIAQAYRTINDPRVPVADRGRDAATAGVRLWVTTKYPALESPIRFASYEEAQLIRAEALAEQGDVAGAMTILNNRRTALGLRALSAGSQAEAVSHVIEERRKELSFEGGHRLTDLIRKSIPWKIGSSPTMQNPYGAVTCWPLPTQERSGA